MPNWCSNGATFIGTESDIANLRERINLAIKWENKLGEGQLLNSGEVKRGYFFNLYIQDSGEDYLEITYETRWAPNLEDVAQVCLEFNVTADVWYEELGNLVYGNAEISANGVIFDDPIPEEFFDLIEELDEEEGYGYKYLPTGEIWDSQYDMIDTMYPIWKQKNKQS